MGEHLVKVDCVCVPGLPCSVLLNDKELTNHSSMMHRNCFCSCYVTMQIIFDFSINKYQTSIFVEIFEWLSHTTQIVALCF